MKATIPSLAAPSEFCLDRVGGLEEPFVSNLEENLRPSQVERDREWLECGARPLLSLWRCREGVLYSPAAARSYTQPYRLPYPGCSHFVRGSIGAEAWRVGMTHHAILLVQPATVGLARRPDDSPSDTDVDVEVAWR
ncbi:hypothetical protein B296_00055217 [Ensete ventricosum]|uniref:Uncharacterized protein n=1 Tax=Ensete ventricosum TaxID=4639 RepID=A0A426Y0Q0_ENSVE|nr:hypothetical protein B296_00055217 [Ensete ventricosum]